MYVTFYQSAMALSLISSVFMFRLSWQRRQFPGALWLSALACSTFIWTLGFLTEANSNTLSLQLLFNDIGYVGSMFVPVTWFVFAIQYTSRGRFINRKRLICLSVLPLVTVILVWTNSWHHLMWYNEHLVHNGPFLVTAKTYAPLFWIVLTYNYALVLIGSGLLIRRLFVGSQLYTAQAISLLVAALLPLIWNAIYVFNLLPLPRKDLTPATFAISGVAIGLGVMRFHLLSAVPFARKFVVDQLKDCVFVFDTSERLLEANPVAIELVKDKSIIGKKLSELLPISNIFERILELKSDRNEFALMEKGQNRFFEAESIPLKDQNGQTMGRIVTIRDISERKTMQAQLMAQDRLVSIGQLAAGIGHEINNPLTPVIGFADLLLKRDLPEDVKHDMKIIYDGAKQTATVVSRLMTFARQTEAARTMCRVDEAVESAIYLVSQRLEKNHIRVVKDFERDLPSTLADPIQLEQVFLNLS